MSRRGSVDRTNRTGSLSVWTPTSRSSTSSSSLVTPTAAGAPRRGSRHCARSARPRSPRTPVTTACVWACPRRSGPSCRVSPRHPSCACSSLRTSSWSSTISFAARSTPHVPMTRSSSRPTDFRRTTWPSSSMTISWASTRSFVVRSGSPRRRSTCCSTSGWAGRCRGSRTCRCCATPTSPRSPSARTRLLG